LVWAEITNYLAITYFMHKRINTVNTAAKVN